MNLSFGQASSHSDSNSNSSEERRLRMSESVTSFLSDLHAEIFVPSSGSSSNATPHSFRRLAASSSEDSFDFGLRDAASARSASSGATIYADAAASLEETPQRQSVDEFIREHVESHRDSSGSGLVAVKPLDARRTPPPFRTPLAHGEARTTTITPHTPASRRRTPLMHLSSSESNVRRLESGSPMPKEGHASEERLNEAPARKPLNFHLGRPRRAPRGVPGSGNRSVLDENVLGANNLGATNLGATNLGASNVLGSAYSSAHGSTQSTHTSSSSKRLRSKIRRAGAATVTNYAFQIGFPDLPLFPSLPLPLENNPSRGAEFDDDADIERDLWGRPFAGRSRSWLVFLGCVCFPPLLPFLAFGYFDEVCGTIERSVKFTALGLAILILVAGSALAIAFAILGW